ncbi:hypothetical protein [Actinoplanes palleronii]|uniref:Alanine-rich protein n=1 Tax=Actinoplanes palleronii TaxID=113570 RepID=A0ABQ4BIT9_9ACTN|nr:hypothetical protein [Actinoplanes palleronii]GIE70596.1 hypothetical protein Apa02nite_067040 [Actinoplanes palleronii]
MVSGHAFPWDVLGDPGFLDRAPQRVTLAAAYHSTRAATPLHPARRIVDARWAALYRPVRSPAWEGRQLRPLAPNWVSHADAFGTAARLLKRAGRQVSAWIVLTHNTRLGTARPDVAVVNCFGEPYPYALCPAHPEVRDYAATLAAEAVLDLDLDGVSLEACGQLGVNHLGHHEKTDGAWTPAEARLLSICCCTACRRGWVAQGLDPASVAAALRAGNPSDEVLAVLLGVRHRNTDLLRAQVLAGLGDLPVTLHAHPDPWATGPSPGLTATAVAEVDALLVPCWPVGSEQLVRAAAEHGKPVDAYVTLLHPMEPDAVGPHVTALQAAGASRLSLYHLGLAPAWRQDLFTL